MGILGNLGKVKLWEPGAAIAYTPSFTFTWWKEGAGIESDIHKKTPNYYAGLNEEIKKIKCSLLLNLRHVIKGNRLKA